MASRQPRTTSATDQAAAGPNNRWLCQMRNVAIPIGNDQISTQAVVRHGTGTRPRTPILAITAITGGSTRSRYLGSAAPCAKAAVTATPQSATDPEASRDLFPVQSA